jgi:hypothetical protein
MIILCDKKGKYYFPTTEHCSGCSDQFKPNQLGIIRLMYSRRDHKTFIFCEQCLKKNKNLGDFPGQQFIGRATNKVVPGTFVVEERRLELQNSSNVETAFDAADLRGCRTIDRTRYARHGEGSKMELPERKTLEEIDMEKDRQIPTHKIESVLKGSKLVKTDFNLLDKVVPKPQIEHRR